MDQNAGLWRLKGSFIANNQKLKNTKFSVTDKTRNVETKKHTRQHPTWDYMLTKNRGKLNGDTRETQLNRIQLMNHGKQNWKQWTQDEGLSK